ncbi:MULTISPECIES: MgtC/SapB family protein [Gordonia]|uniref:MgtC/SapB/SrpB/YhiD N-terminal domain-containing protein n=2 Tax=Gordonia TaxID=2053 RepID=L7LNS2_9ACTN|nr:MULTISPECIES: MgtC/SapB family protein [Gordonia]AUH67454.1 MgtC/SapB family protein [Gordonia sp. YC-JH1]KJR09152.1 MgtC/SapB transporter [Gordonia sihwensis]KXT57043.1 MgtC/SapB transporter [Gordonia sp. QH-12]MBY4571889.1 MgtC/SapB transporter [Gordonia sihwensis]WFN92888.1 MgtC/SapB family protein [Gordonia sihwensis]
MALADALEQQGWPQVGELVLAFVLSALIGLERQLRGRSAGLRTQAIVGTSAALFMLISKYGFMNVLSDEVVVDPSRVAAQVVSGIGFLGAGIILTRRGAVRGLTTAASVWETAAIGMAAGAGLWLLAVVVTALHFVTAYGLRALSRLLPGQVSESQIEVTYADGHGLLRQIIESITSGGWTIRQARPQDVEVDGTAALILEVAGGARTEALVAALAEIDGVREVQVLSEQESE